MQTIIAIIVMVVFYLVLIIILLYDNYSIKTAVKLVSIGYGSIVVLPSVVYLALYLLK